MYGRRLTQLAYRVNVAPVPRRACPIPFLPSELKRFLPGRRKATRAAAPIRASWPGRAALGCLTLRCATWSLVTAVPHPRDAAHLASRPSELGPVFTIHPVKARSVGPSRAGRGSSAGCPPPSAGVQPSPSDLPLEIGPRGRLQCETPDCTCVYTEGGCGYDCGNRRPADCGRPCGNASNTQWAASLRRSRACRARPPQATQLPGGGGHSGKLEKLGPKDHRGAFSSRGRPVKNGLDAKVKSVQKTATKNHRRPCGPSRHPVKNNSQPFESSLECRLWEIPTCPPRGRIARKRTLEISR
jgi:hypothetical protein